MCKEICYAIASNCIKGIYIVNPSILSHCQSLLETMEDEFTHHTELLTSDSGSPNYEENSPDASDQTRPAEEGTGKQDADAIGSGDGSGDDGGAISGTRNEDTHAGDRDSSVELSVETIAEPGRGAIMIEDDSESSLSDPPDDLDDNNGEENEQPRRSSRVQKAQEEAQRKIAEEKSKKDTASKGIGKRPTSGKKTGTARTTPNPGARSKDGRQKKRRHTVEEESESESEDRAKSQDQDDNDGENLVPTHRTISNMLLRLTEDSMNTSIQFGRYIGEEVGRDATRRINDGLRTILNRGRNTLPPMSGNQKKGGKKKGGKSDKNNGNGKGEKGVGVDKNKGVRKGKKKMKR